MGGMRRNRPAFNLQDITSPLPAPPPAPADDAATNTNTEPSDDDNAENDSATTPSSATQTQNPPFINRARLGAGRPLPKDGPQAATPSLPQRRPLDLGSPFANFSRIVYVSLLPLDAVLTLFSPQRSIRNPQF